MAARAHKDDVTDVLNTIFATHDAVVRWLAREHSVPWPVPPKAFAQWLTKAGVAEMEVHALMRGLPRVSLQNTVVEIYSSKDIQGSDAALRRHGLLQIGRCLDGDSVVLDLSSPQLGAVAFVDHEIYWSQKCPDPRAALRYVAINMTAFLLATARQALPFEYGGMFEERQETSNWRLVFDDEV